MLYFNPRSLLLQLVFSFILQMVISYNAFAATYGTGLNETSVGYVSTRDGGKLLYGNQAAASGFVYVVKLDSFYNVEWARTFNYPGYSLEVGGADQISSGNYIALCSIDSLCSVWMCKFDTLGNLMVDSLYPNNDVAFCYFARGVASCSVNQVTGMVYYDGPTTDNYDTLFNVDTNLVRLTTTNYCSPAGRAVTTDNSLFPGAIRYNGIVLVYDTNLTSGFFANDYAEVDSGVLIVGSTNYYTQSSVSQNYLLRVYGQDTLWSRAWGTTSCSLTHIAKLASNTFYMSGDSLAGGTLYPYLALSDSFGNFSWQHVFPPSVSIKSLRVTSAGTVEVFGDSMAVANNSDYWLVEFDSLGAQVSRGGMTGIQHPSGPDVRLYPNPAAREVRIRSERILATCQVRLTDVNGRECPITAKSVSPVELVIPVTGLPSGVYSVVITDADFAIRKSLIVE